MHRIAGAMRDSPNNPVVPIDIGLKSAHTSIYMRIDASDKEGLAHDKAEAKQAKRPDSR